MLFFVILFFLGLFIFFLIKGNKNTKDVAVKKITVRCPDRKASAKNIKILHLSDLHLENLSISPKELDELISAESIDLIALTGDFLDRKRSIPKLSAYLEVLRKTNPTYGTYAVFGNHDYVLKEEDFETLKKMLQHYGIKTLQNEHVTIQLEEECLNIIGIDDYTTNRSYVQKAFHGVEEGMRLVLTHDPSVILEMENIPFDYLLSGHFHGGQINLPKPYHLFYKGELPRMNIIKGLHYHNKRPFYISEGLGQTGVNIRIGSRPEITFHQFS